MVKRRLYRRKRRTYKKRRFYRRRRTFGAKYDGGTMIKCNVVKSVLYNTAAVNATAWINWGS